MTPPLRQPSLERPPRHPALRVLDRGGTSLIECLLYVFMAGAIGILGFEIMNRLLRLEGNETRSHYQERLLERLERQWRDDAHRATEFSIAANEPGSTVALTIGPSVVTYSSNSEGILIRTAREGTQQQAQERWELDANATFRSSPDRRLLTLELTPLPTPRRNKSLSAPPGESTAVSPVGRVLLDASVGTARSGSNPEEASR